MISTFPFRKGVKSLYSVYVPTNGQETILGPAHPQLALAPQRDPQQEGELSVCCERLLLRGGGGLRRIGLDKCFFQSLRCCPRPSPQDQTRLQTTGGALRLLAGSLPRKAGLAPRGVGVRSVRHTYRLLVASECLLVCHKLSHFLLLCSPGKVPQIIEPKRSNANGPLLSTFDQKSPSSG